MAEIARLSSLVCVVMPPLSVLTGLIVRVQYTPCEHCPRAIWMIPNEPGHPTDAVAGLLGVGLYEPAGGFAHGVAAGFLAARELGASDGAQFCWCALPVAGNGQQQSE
ncbi:hypothetical protein NYA9BBAC_00374 [Salinibacterium sp. NYA9b]